MISASHNRFEDNGVKLFAPGGRKLTDDVETALEAELHALLAHEGAPAARTGDAVGTVVDGTRRRSTDGPTRCCARSTVAARGAVAGGRLRQRRRHRRSPRRCSRALGATVEVIHDEPDGTNINAGCGSTYPEDLQKAVIQRGADVGLAFDGDADRVLAVDADGRLIDGDQIIGITAIDRRDHGRLAKDTVVATVMANLGFRLGHARARHRGARGARRRSLRARGAGRRGLTLGGEQSGHVIFADLATTGDGLLTVRAAARRRRPAPAGRSASWPTPP